MIRNNLTVKQALCIVFSICFIFTSGCIKNSREDAAFKLAYPGKEKIVDYAKYGTFEGIGTSDYKYVIKDQAALSKAVGEGIYPNSSALLKDPDYKNFKKQGKLDGTHWDFINTKDYQANFYKWANAPEPNGVKLFYSALALEKAGHLVHAIKAYQAIIVHFPRSIAWTYWRTPWYVGQVAADRIKHLCITHPELGIDFIDASIIIEHGYDDNLRNDVFLINPGKIIKTKPSLMQPKKSDLKRLDIIKETGDDHIKLVQYSNKSWQLIVDGSPYIIKGIAYSPSKIGQSPDEGTLDDWMQADYNNNNKVDGPYDSWVDENKNNIKDENEKTIGDFSLLWQMGANTMRIYHHASNEALMEDMYQNYGIMCIIGDFLGAYTVGSGAEWYKGTDYTDETQQQNMLNSVKEMVDKYKDKPYVLMWVLGNENNYGVANNVKKNPQAYYKFVNTAAKYIKQHDPHKRPVAICNGEIIFLDIFAQNCPDVDIFGVNSYRGDYGFGHLWKCVKHEADKPVLVTEYGCPAYSSIHTQEQAEKFQAEYIKNGWLNIMANSDGYGQGNALGAVVFEFIDEWWKAYEPHKHDNHTQWPGPFPDGWGYEEWFGLFSQGNGENSPYMRQPRESYFTLKKLWK